MSDARELPLSNSQRSFIGIDARPYEAKVSDSFGTLHVYVGNGRVQCGDGWYPKNERQMRRAIKQAERQAAKLNAKQDEARRLAGMYRRGELG